MRNSSPRSKRGLPAAQAGTSVIAAIALAAILGGIVLGFNALQSASANPQSQSAEAATATAPAGSVNEQCQAGYQYITSESPTGQIKVPGKIISGCGQKNSDGSPMNNTVVAEYNGKQISIQCATQGVIFAKDINEEVTATTCMPGGATTASPPNPSGSGSGSGSPTVNPNTASPTTGCVNGWDYDVDAPCTSTPTCNAGQTAVNGTCTSVVQPPCPTGWYQVNSQCMDATTAADACSSGSQGACAALNVSNPYCPSGKYDSLGSCIVSTSPPPSCDPGPCTQPTETYPCGDGICFSEDASLQKQYEALGWSCSTADGGTVCVAPAGTQSCTNGATNPPTCNNNSQVQPCTNGATNPPTCNNGNNNNNNNRNGNNGNSPQAQPQPRTSTFPQQQTQPQQNQNSCSGLSAIFGGCSQQGNVSCQLQVSPNPVQQGMPATLQWTTSGSVYSAQVSNVGNVPVPSGSYSVYPTGSQNYSMTVVDQYGNQNTCNANATVTPRQNTNPTTNPNQNPTAQNPYGTGTNGQPCQQPPAQPTSSSCNVGSMQPTVSNGCTTGYQCVPNGSTSSGQTPSPQISCQPQIADVGTSVAISYSCGNSTDSTGQGFATDDQTSGSATAMIAPPPAGTNTASYGITCINNNAQSSGGAAATASAQCSIQLNAPSIVLVANPSSIPSGSESSIGWVTAGMKSCVASSPTDTAFTQDNATDLDVNGMAQTSSITQTTEYDLTCTSIGGTTKTASVKVAAN